MGPSLHRFRVRPHECDAYGHVNNATYLNYLETGRLEFLRDLGLDYFGLLKEGYGIWVAEAHLTYLSPALPDEELILETAPSRVGSVSVDMSHNLTKSDGTPVLRAILKLALVNADEGRPARLPDAWMQAFRSVTKA